MTSHEHPPQDAVAVIRTKADRVPFPRGFMVVALGIVCAVLAFAVVILLLGMNQSIEDRQQLACQVQKLGGSPVVPGVSCPPTPKASPTPSRALGSGSGEVSPQPIPSIVLMVPKGSGAPYIVYRNIYPTPSSTPRATPAATRASPSPRHSASPSPSPSPSRVICIVPVLPRCQQPRPIPFAHVSR